MAEICSITRVSVRSRLLSVVLVVALLAISACAESPMQQQSARAGGKYDLLEQDVFDETNRLRANPKGYAGVLEDVRKRIRDNIYYPENTEIGVRMKEGSRAVKEAIAVISKEGPLPQLQWSDALAAVARAHVRDTGPKGLVRHESSSGKTLSERMEPVMAREGFTAIAENIAYGYDLGRDVVAHLFIDDGVPGRGHRKNLLLKRLNYSGVACGEHRRYRNMCVAIYAYREE